MKKKIKIENQDYEMEFESDFVVSSENDLKEAVQEVAQPILDEALQMVDQAVEQLRGEVMQAIPEPIPGEKGEDGKDYIITDNDKEEIAIDVENRVTPKIDKKIKEIAKTIKGQPGEKGEPGDKYTLTEEDTNAIALSVESQLQPIIEEETKAENLRDKLESLEGAERLDAKAIKNLPSFINNILPGGGGRLRVSNGGTIDSVSQINFLGTAISGYSSNGNELNITIDGGSGGGTWGTITGTLSDQTDLQSALDAKQATLVSATNIKTINGNSILGSGDLVISGGIADGDYGDITVSGGGTALTIDNQAVSFAKIQNIATSRILGRTTAGSGSIEELTVGTSLSLSAGSLNTIQGIRTSDSPTFTGLTLSGLTQYRIPIVGASGLIGDNANFYYNTASIPTFRTAGVAEFRHGAPTGSAVDTGIDFVRQSSDTAGTTVLTIQGGNKTQWNTASKGIKIFNHTQKIEIEATTTFINGGFGVSTAWFGGDPFLVQDYLYVRQGSGIVSTQTWRYASSPYPQWVLSAPKFRFQTKTSSAWPDGSAGLGYGSSRLLINDDGRIGIGDFVEASNLPDRLLHIEDETTVTNAVENLMRMTHTSTGTVTTNFGIGREWEMENASNIKVVVADEQVFFTDATNGSEDVSWRLRLDRAGVLTTAITVNSLGQLDAVSYAVNGSPGASGTFTTADGKTVTVTSGVITSIV